MDSRWGTLIVDAGPNGGQRCGSLIAAGNTSGITAVVFTGNHRGDQWPGSRVISAQKANTANAFSLPNLALSTANLYRLVQPGASLFGLQESNPVDTLVAYQGPAGRYGQDTDPMVAGRLAASTYSAAAWRSTVTASSSAPSASAATPRAPTTTSPGRRARSWG